MNRRDSGGGRKSGGSTVHQRIEELRLQREERRRSAEEYKVGSDTYYGKEDPLSIIDYELCRRHRRRHVLS